MIACGDAPPPLQADLAGSWDIVFDPTDAPQRSGIAELAWVGDDPVLEGEVTMFDPDEERRYGVLEAMDVDVLGIALELVELTGSRQLFIELMPVANDETAGGWRSRWGCSEPPDNFCGEEGSLAWAR